MAESGWPRRQRQRKHVTPCRTEGGKEVPPTYRRLRGDPSVRTSGGSNTGDGQNTLIPPAVWQPRGRGHSEAARGGGRSLRRCWGEGDAHCGRLHCLEVASPQLPPSHAFLNTPTPRWAPKQQSVSPWDQWVLTALGLGNPAKVLTHMPKMALFYPKSWVVCLQQEQPVDIPASGAVC